MTGKKRTVPSVGAQGFSGAKNASDDDDHEDHEAGHQNRNEDFQVRHARESGPLGLS